MDDMTAKEQFIFLFKTYLKQAESDARKWREQLEQLEGNKDAVIKAPCNSEVIGDAATLEIIGTAIGTAVAIVNMSDNDNVRDMAANIADTLIAITDVKDL